MGSGWNARTIRRVDTNRSNGVGLASFTAYGVASLTATPSQRFLPSLASDSAMVQP